MKTEDMTPEFKKAYEIHYERLKKLGLIQPKLSSIAKQYAKLDLEVEKLKN